ncbi:hypothetical protein [Wolbachia endosymbiont of Atemnus politus]|uniref:hypothetical protein n=1 Tax=Wolbachia endosymbiont of Atemnus politus TaxID=2682840 RepID=UPI001C550A38|nr:hypothetical protein [Wolbachia endosymbiont of Atemnus politus]
MQNPTTLDLSCKEIGDEGVKALSEALKSGKLPNLTTLNLAYNEIGDEGVKALSEALKNGKLPNLKDLTLYFMGRYYDGSPTEVLKDIEAAQITNKAMRVGGVCGVMAGLVLDMVLPV